MMYVYILKSLKIPERYYVGSTHDLKRRLKEHNAGYSHHTNRYKPWRIELYLGFTDERKARKFETYLKSGSGRAFAKMHF
ncbi:GIY-YIG nuclease family protein [Candidatus Berkiella aquae]|nr:GIY-YIG nuclease family protein [Candidatus Berkiella aquae]MCS5712196.1 GIY-YIG nuclease family protein [Candidatus Berkiella aquae]